MQSSRVYRVGNAWVAYLGRKWLGWFYTYDEAVAVRDAARARARAGKR